MRQRLRLGVMCPDHLQLQFWQQKVIKQMLDTGHVELVLRVHPLEERTKINILKKLLGKLKSPQTLPFTFYNRCWVAKRVPCKRSVDAEDMLGGLPSVFVKPELRGKFTQLFSSDDCASIAAYTPDVLLRFGFGIIRGEVLDIPTYGVWSYHHGDPRMYRGSPPAFWETYHDHPVVGIVLQRLTGALDSGLMLRFGQVTRRGSYANTLEAQYMAATEFAASVCKEIIAGHHSCDTSCIDMDKDGQGPIYQTPPASVLLSYFAKSLYRRWTIFLFKVFHVDIWSIAVVKKDTGALLKEGLTEEDDITWFDVRSIQKQDIRYVADPFAYKHGEMLHILVEDFSYSKGKGIISRLVFEDGKFQSGAVPILERKWHLSYPYISQHAQPDRYSLTPEMVERGLQEAYECVRGTDEVLSEKQDSIGINVVDPSYLKHAGKYWLFCTKHGVRSSDTLFIFYKDSLEGSWQPHTQNPIKCDVSSSRPGGSFFTYAGKLYRPTQDSRNSYGGALSIQRVETLTVEMYRETTVQIVTPLPDFPEGLHTLHIVEDGLAVIDGKRYQFAWNGAFLRRRKSRATQQRRRLLKETAKI